jgi:hypothetical protein
MESYSGAECTLCCLWFNESLHALPCNDNSEQCTGKFTTKKKDYCIVVLAFQWDGLCDAQGIWPGTSWSSRRCDRLRCSYEIVCISQLRMPVGSDIISHSQQWKILCKWLNCKPIQGTTAATIEGWWQGEMVWVFCEHDEPNGLWISSLRSWLRLRFTSVDNLTIITYEYGGQRIHVSSINTKWGEQTDARGRKERQKKWDSNLLLCMH